MISNKEVKRYLSQTWYASMRVKKLQEKIAEIRSNAMKQTQAWSETPTGGKLVSSPQQTWIEKALPLQKKLETAVTELIVRENLASDVIELLEYDRDKMILEAYHLHRMTIDEIAEQYNYSSRQVIRIKENAYYKIAKVVNQNPAIEAKIRRGLPAEKDGMECHPD